MAFIVPSNRLFWGRGAILSSEGRRIMDTMGSFLRGVPSRIVISENGPENEPSGSRPGLPRAWALMEYLITKQNIDGARFSISAASPPTQTREGPENNQPAAGRSEPERTVKIALLEWSLRN
jgi:hypothetical protein